MLKDFDTELVADDGGILTEINGQGIVEVGVDDSTFLTQLALIVRGENGQDGQPGPPGGAVFHYQQSIPATQWSIHHNLGRFPPITVIDSGGTVQEGQYTYVDLNNVQLNFALPFAGDAYLG